MDMTEFHFRTAAFGGFQKQDVLSYIETSAREHAERTEALEQELGKLRQSYESLEERWDSTEDRIAVLTVDNQRLGEELLSKTQTLETARADAAEKGRLLSDAQAELAALRERVKALEPSARAYEAIKDRTAGLELEAHQRAQLIEEQAHEKARAVAQQVEQWLCKVQSGYDRLRTDLNAALAHASGEMERVSTSLNAIAGEFNDHDSALADIGEEFRAASGPKPPQPLSLDGEE